MKYKKIYISDEELDQQLIELYNAAEKLDLNEVDRLGLAYCRLSSYIWDDLIGQCPTGFYKLPRFSSKEDVITRSDCVKPYMEYIKARIGKKLHFSPIPRQIYLPYAPCRFSPLV